MYTSVLYTSGMNLVQRSVQKGGKLAPLIIEKGLTEGTGLMNPSIFIDDDGDILCILRHVNYTLYHSEHMQKFPSNWGPLSYLHPEKDQRLVTINYLCRLDKDLNVTDYCRIDTSALDVPAVWEFVGQEDARLVQWDGDYYAIGVRRDTKENGEGRMEYSKLKIDKKKWSAKEVKRVRIPAPGKDDTYCEKNWYPILDRPYHFVKWTSPTEIVKADPTKPKSEAVIQKYNRIPLSDQRGGSHLVPYGDVYLSVTHEVGLFKNYLNQKDGFYRHRLIVWDKDLNIIGVSPEEFSFLDARIEFAAGLAVLGKDLLISFGFQDNCAFVLRVPEIVVEEMIEEAETSGLY
jgi:hypothetical protein